MSNLRLEELVRIYAAIGYIDLSADLETDQEDGSGEEEAVIEGLRFDLEILTKRMRGNREER